MPKIQKTKKPSKDNKLTDKLASFAKLPLLIPAKYSKEVKEISKFFKKSTKLIEKKDSSKLYTQVLVPMTSKILKIKEMFSKLQVRKINNIHKIINGVGKLKPKVNMTTKKPSRKQVIIPMSNKNKTRFIESSSKYIANLNRVLKNIKSDVMANSVCIDQAGITIITNKVAIFLDLQIIKRYVKNINQINLNNVETPPLPQSKSYLKIIDIPYHLENNNTLIMADIIKTIIRNNYIFNNIVVVSKPRIIKLLPKLDMVIIWLDIWNVQKGSKAKELINRCFNIRNYITTI